MEQQKTDPSLKEICDTREGVFRMTVSFPVKYDILYHHSRYAKVRVFDQFAVPVPYRPDILSVCRGVGWNGRSWEVSNGGLLTVLKDVENHVKACHLSEGRKASRKG